MIKAHRGAVPLILAAVFAMTLIGGGQFAEAAGQVYVNDGQNVLAGDIGSAYAVGDTGTVSTVGGAYAITGNGVVQIGTSSAEIPNLDPNDDGSSVRVSLSTVRVGLYYYYSTSRNTALNSANLQNKTGSGYQFGYYDASRSFIALGSTPETMLTMVPNVNTAVTGGTVGCYNLKLLGAFNSFDAAKSAAAQYADGFPAYINGAYYVLLGNYQSASEANDARVARGVTADIFTGSNRCVSVTKTGTTTMLFLFDAGTSANLAVHPLCGSGKAVTWFKGYSYYGDFEYFRYISDKLTVVNVVSLEDYIKGVITYEMSPSWPLEALKAQAVCARSYFAASVNGTYKSYGFDLTADTNSQAYFGTGRATANSDAAVDATLGEYATYNGAVCTTFYYSSNGGGSEDSENIFTNALAYCRGVIDPFEAAVPDSLNSHKSWHYEFTDVQLASKLSAYGYSGSAITRVQPTYSDTGNVVSIVFSDANGNSKTLTKDANYYVLGLPSVHYTITQSGSTFVIDGGGWGHNVGMSQFGAYSMAKNYSMNYRQILRFYYTGIKISDGVMA